MLTKFFIGLDLGQANDYTAVAVIERLKPEGDAYHVRHLERVRGMPYPAIVDKILKMMESPLLKRNAALVIDQTGCGRPVFDMFTDAKLDPIGVSIHGGDAATHDGRAWRVPKRDLVGCLQVLLQSSRLKVASKLELGPMLQRMTAEPGGSQKETWLVASRCCCSPVGSRWRASSNSDRSCSKRC